jgi:ribose 5-phosphate isomerase B
MKTIYLGADHAGFKLKETVKAFFKKKGWKVEDVTPEFNASDDYPPIAFRVAQNVSAVPDGLGLLFCGSGNGMEIAANRILGARAISPASTEEAKIARHDDHANILVFGQKLMKPVAVQKIVETWLKTKPGTATRYLRRVSQLDEPR